jgi:hypothetical protein
LAQQALSTWPTPLASESKRGVKDRQYGDKSGRDLSTMAAGWPTPPGGAWPTPTAGDAKRSGSRVGNPQTAAHPGTSLTDLSCRSGRPLPMTCSHGTPCRPVLNPRFVAWLQGLSPLFWDLLADAHAQSSCERSETPSSPKSPS